MCVYIIYIIMYGVHHIELLYVCIYNIYYYVWCASYRAVVCVYILYVLYVLLYMVCII